MPPLLQPAEPDHAADVVRLVNGITRSTWGVMVRAQNDGIDAVWHHPVLTPQEVCDALGINAVAIFDFHAALTDLLYEQALADGIDPLTVIKFPTEAFTREQDGRVTIQVGVPYVPPT